MKNVILLIAMLCLTLTSFAQQFTGNNNINDPIWRNGPISIGSSTTSLADFSVIKNNTNSKILVGNPAMGLSTLRLMGSHVSDYAFIQAGTSDSDNSSKLRITRYNTSTGNLADFEVYSIWTSFSGNVVVGTGIEDRPAGYNLYVAQGILTEKVKVAVKNSSNWSDHVFAEDYELQPLECVEEYVKENKHLPGVPSAKEMVQEGLDVAAMDAKLLEKIEELTLYLIELKKENEALKTRVANLENK